VYVLGLNECRKDQVSDRAAAAWQLGKMWTSAASFTRTLLDAVNAIIEREANDKAIDQRQVVERISYVMLICYWKLR